MGLPNINILFKEAGNTAVKRGQKGIVALILKDSTSNGLININTENEIPAGLSQGNKEQIRLALMGAVKVVAYVQAPTLTDYNAAMKQLETIKWDYIAVPSISDTEVNAVAAWIKDLRDKKDIKVKAVLPNCAADHEGIINFATNDIAAGGTTYHAKDYCSRIAGILAGIPLSVSSTYQVLSEVEDVTHMTKAEFDAAIDSGKLVLINDGEKVKIARGVNSLANPTGNKGEDFKKIKIVDTIDMIHDDIKRTANDNYIGKVPNTYDNKCILITAIQAYYEELEGQQILDRGKNSIEIDMETQKTYLKSAGTDISKMSVQEIKEANTHDKIFLESSIKIVDAVEDINLNVTI